MGIKNRYREGRTEEIGGSRKGKGMKCEKGKGQKKGGRDVEERGEKTHVPLSTS